MDTATKVVPRPGRPKRGERRAIIPAFPVEHYRWYHDQAHARQLAFSEYACADLAREHGLTVPDYIKDPLVDAPAVPDALPLDELAGETKRATIRVPAAHFEHYRLQAQRQGISLTDYVRRTLARLHRLVPHDDAYEGRDLLSA